MVIAWLASLLLFPLSSSARSLRGDKRTPEQQDPVLWELASHLERRATNCPRPLICANGQCTAVVINTDLFNCNGAGNSCNASELCISGECVPLDLGSNSTKCGNAPCQTGQWCDEDVCRPIQIETDWKSCGPNSEECKPGSLCVNGVCSKIDIGGDVLHCGGADVVCEPGNYCLNQLCTPLTIGRNAIADSTDDDCSDGNCGPIIVDLDPYRCGPWLVDQLVSVAPVSLLELPSLEAKSGISLGLSLDPRALLDSLLDSLPAFLAAPGHLLVPQPLLERLVLLLASFPKTQEVLFPAQMVLHQATLAYLLMVLQVMPMLLGLFLDSLEHPLVHPAARRLPALLMILVQAVALQSPALEQHPAISQVAGLLVMLLPALRLLSQEALLVTAHLNLLLAPGNPELHPFQMPLAPPRFLVLLVALLGMLLVMYLPLAFPELQAAVQQPGPVLLGSVFRKTAPKDKLPAAPVPEMLALVLLLVRLVRRLCPVLPALPLDLVLPVQLLYLGPLAALQPSLEHPDNLEAMPLARSLSQKEDLALEAPLVPVL
ncbi:hypothetical protein ACHAQA_001564 [Verticillium albo-atrum]